MKRLFRMGAYFTMTTINVALAFAWAIRGNHPLRAFSIAWSLSIAVASFVGFLHVLENKR